MRLTVILEPRLLRTPDGAVWTRSVCTSSFWNRYLEGFSEVRAVARIDDAPAPPPEARRADGPGISFTPLPSYRGVLGYIAQRAAVRRAVGAAMADDSALILRVCSPIAGCGARRLRRLRKPYAVEVVGDAWETFAPGAVRHPLRPLLRRHFAAQQRRQCAEACAAAYVTEQALQRRYPIGSGPAGGCRPLSLAISDVEIGDEALVAAPRPPVAHHGPWNLVLVASLAQLYKAPDVLLEAMARAVGAGLDLRLALVGDGRYRATIAAQAERLGLGSRVAFRGQLASGAAVRDELDRAHLFVLPSRTEGLPRAMVEAMARGLPCIGSTVGGIPELLAAEDLVPPDDAGALAARIIAMLGDAPRMARASARNLERARAFHDHLLRERRLVFYRHLATCTAAWIARGRR